MADKRGRKPKKSTEIVAAEAPMEKVEEVSTIEKKEPEDIEMKSEHKAGVPIPDPAPLFTKTEVEAMIADALAKANISKAPSADEVVTILYLDECAPKSTLEIPGYGTMRPYGYLEVPKREFGNKFMSALVRKLLDKRILIVVSGLTQAERERWNCDYKEGEILDEQTFDKMLDYPTPKLAEIFEKLCVEHQRFVACRMITAKEKGDNRISVEKAKRINDLSKKNDPNGMLKPVLDAFGAEISG